MSARAALAISPAGVLVEVEGVSLSVLREGHGPPLVCLHAIGHGSRDFEPFVRAARERYEVICVDWPGHGRSDADSEPPSAERYAALLVALLDRLGIVQPIIVGNSIGGTAALLYAKQRSVRALVLCNSGGLVKINLPVILFARALVYFFAAGARGKSWFRAWYSWYYRRLVMPTALALEQRARIIAAGSEYAPLLRDAWRSFARPPSDLRALASDLEAPIWCAWGKYDRVIPLAFVKPAIQRMKAARLTVFSTGHAAFLESPREFSEAFFAFADGLLAVEPSVRAESARGLSVRQTLDSPNRPS